MVELLRAIRDDGSTDPALDPGLSEADATRLYRWMVLQRTLDTRMLALQRQGRIGFYGPSIGQEAAVVAPAMALGPDDWLVPQYREPGAALVRGMPLRDMICQFIGNAGDPLQGRQMPCHYVYAKGHYLSVSSPVGTQIPHAAGIAWAMRIRGEPAAVLVYFGDGATSTPDFHYGLNFAGVFRAPCVFLCNNNQWAISLPVHKQTASATLASKAAAYGLPGIRVDGNDALAVYGGVKTALDRARAGDGPTLIEAVTCRIGPHSSSDDPSRYRDEDDLAPWRTRDPIALLRGHLERRGIWDGAREASLARAIEAEIGAAIAEAEAMPPVTAEGLLADVYAEMPAHLHEQLDEVRAARGR